MQDFRLFRQKGWWNGEMLCPVWSQRCLTNLLWHTVIAKVWIAMHCKHSQESTERNNWVLYHTTQTKQNTMLPLLSYLSWNNVVRSHAYLPRMIHTTHIPSIPFIRLPAVLLYFLRLWQWSESARARDAAYRVFFFLNDSPRVLSSTDVKDEWRSKTIWLLICWNIKLCKGTCPWIRVVKSLRWRVKWRFAT